MTTLYFLNIHLKTILTLFLLVINTKCETVKYRTSNNEIKNDNIEGIKLFDDAPLHLFKFASEDAVLIPNLNENSSVKNHSVEHATEKNANENVIKTDAEKSANESETKDTKKFTQLEEELLDYLKDTLSRDRYDIVTGVSIVPAELNSTINDETPRSFGAGDDEDVDGSFDDIVMTEFRKYAEGHVLNVNVPQTGRLFFKFFGLKKLMLPLFFGVQIVKSILLAMFLPSILGSIGKIVGKGVSSFSTFSQNGIEGGDQNVEDLDFKDGMGYATEQDVGYGMTHTAADQPSYSYPIPNNNIQTQTAYSANLPAAAATNNAMSRYSPGGHKVTYVNSPSDEYYNRYSTQKQDYKVFHDIPASSMLLTNYDPFYSPLLSRLDAVFQQLGFSNSEPCRERLVCLMYSNPAKYAPYSNLVSAQLSRELNELKKPTSDNPDILRFFKYMKAAKDGQDGVNCTQSQPNCESVSEGDSSPALITTYNDINKLVQARHLKT